MHRARSRGLSRCAPLALLVAACSSGAPGSPSPTGTTSPDITPADLRARLTAYADDSMLGRRSGTLGGVKATDFLAAEARRIGLEPAGENGTYFQTVPIVERTLEPDASLTVDGTTIAAWDELLPRDQGRNTRDVDGATAIYGGTWNETDQSRLLPMDRAAGRLVVVTVAPSADGVPPGLVTRAAFTERFRTSTGIVVVTLDNIGHTDRLSLMETGAQLTAGTSPEAPAFMYTDTRGAEAIMGAPLEGLAPGAEGRVVRGHVRFVERPAPFPVRNVVARLPGSDPALRGQFLAIGAHNDHEGIAGLAEDHDSLRAFNLVMRPEGANTSPGRPTAAQQAKISATLDSLRRVRPTRRDSIMNGADDDGSGSVAVLEIAERLARGPAKPKRSTLFVWHAAEELSLLGSDWYTRHPTVPRDSIVAQLNIDMIGRGMARDIAGGGPAYLQLIGSRRLSTELGDAVERVNREGGHGFAFDYRFDADGHPSNYYCRSDHANYARYAIPVTFFSTGSHADYHQLTDEVEYIDFDKLTRVTKLVADVALAVGDMDHRPVVDKPKPDPDAPCKQ